MSDRDHAGDPAGPFPTPPLTFTDGEGREIAIRAVGDGPEADEFEALVAMYLDFDPADRAQGLPPGREHVLRDWLDTLFSGRTVNVVAWNGDRAAGHATLVADEREPPENGGENPSSPGGEPAYELAIFVHQDYQGAGIGTRLIRCLLGAGVERGVERVWLTVERWNEPAVALYRGVGFETTNAERFELEMGLRLDRSTASE